MKNSSVVFRIQTQNRFSNRNHIAQNPDEYFFHETRKLSPQMRHLLWAARAGVEPDFILPLAPKILDETNCWALIKRLARGTHKVKSPAKWGPIDPWICRSWRRFDVNEPPWSHLPGLCSWTIRGGAAFISYCLHLRGSEYVLSPGAYRTRINRLRRNGEKLVKKKSVVKAEFQRRTGTLIITKL
jgi:hypothetical protein